MNDTATQIQSDETRQVPSQNSNYSVIGLGASAGGIRALQLFFEQMPSDSGMAFVVVMHLAPDYESNLAQIIQQRTSMPVMQVNEPIDIAPNNVYVIPPGKHLAIEENQLQPREPQQTTGKRIAVDLLFRTMSAAFGPRAVAIVLSGTDSDGVIGIKHIKEQGGLTIIQDPSEAEFDSMPRAALATGMVDWVLPVREMPGRLREFRENEARMRVPPEQVPQTEAALAENGNSGGPVNVAQVPSVTDEEALAEVLRFLRGQTSHDFAHYKRATVLRRVARRLQVNLIENISEYLGFLRTHPAEVTALLHDLLISVTNFFRDREAFAALESHIPQLFADKREGDQVRVWVAACATGEEAYSVAMLLSEHASKLESPPSILVFATDLDEDVIHNARAGLYPPTIEADVSAERLRRFFHREQGRYRISKEIRERVLFSAHDILKDSPFSRLDLVTCRNLLIYLKREAQNAVFGIFHFALRPGGLLFLGASEGLDDSSSLFAPLEKQYRLYVRRAVSRPGWQIPTLPLSTPVSNRLPALTAPRTLVFSGGAAVPSAPPASAPPVAESRAHLLGDLHFTLIERFAPPSVIVNDNYDIVHLSEHAGQFLQFSGGEVSTNLLKVVQPSLRTELRTALFRAGRGEANVTAARVPVEVEGASRLLNIHVRPARKADETEGFILVVFELVSESAEPAPPPSSQMVAQHLEDENQRLKEQLSVTVEQYEASLEELKAANEELQAINEEMRSATEELETSKEELQSINEELTTVNQELKSNVDEVSRVNSDLQNLMASTDIGTIFLDREFQIKRFTPRAQEIFNLISTDIGRPLSNITHSLNYPELTADVERVLRDLHSSEREVRSDTHWFLARALPYRTLDDYIDGIVLTFVDITSRKKAEDALRASEERLRLAIDAAQMFSWEFDVQAQAVKYSENAERLTGLKPVSSFADSLAFVHPDDRNLIQRAFDDRTSTRNTFDLEVRAFAVDKSIDWYRVSGVIVCDENGEPLRAIGVWQNITERKRYQDNIEALNQQLSRLNTELHQSLTETYHRVKNNLQVAAALVDVIIQGDKETIPLAEARRVGQHIRAMANIHDLLTLEVKSDAMASGVLIKALMDKLASLLQQAVGMRELRFDVDDMRLPAKMASSLSILLNELVANAAKHGKGIIEITLKTKADQVYLMVCDDGPGFPAGFNSRQAAHTGLELVEGLSRVDLGGEARFENLEKGGACVTIIFPRPPL